MGSAPSNADDFFKSVGKAIGKAAGDTGKAVGKAAGDTGKAVEKAAGDTGKAVEKAAGDTGKAVEKAAGDTGKAVEKAAGDTGKALEKAGHDTGHAAKEVGKYVEKHPWETVAAVALIAGGGYLVICEGYVLSVTVQGVEILSVTSGTTSGIVVGSALAGIGTTGTVIVATMSSPAGTSSTTLNTNQTPSASAPQNSGPTQAGKREVPTQSAPPAVTQTSQNTTAISTIQFKQTDTKRTQSVMYWPWIPATPNEWQRLNYANRVSKWAEKVEPIGSFDPTKSPNLTPAELKLLDALTSLYAIKDSEGALQAKEQAEERRFDNFIVDQVEDKIKEKLIEYIFGEFAATAFSWYGNLGMALSPTLTGDDAIQFRDMYKRELFNQLRAYAEKRNPPPSSPDSILRRIKPVPDAELILP